jgi:hypothetical protein
VGLEFSELIEVFVEGAVQASFVTLDSGEGVCAVVVVAEEAGEELGGGEVILVLVLEEIRGGAGEAAEGPEGVGDAFGEHSFAGGFGGEVVEDFVFEGVEGGGAFGGEEGDGVVGGGLAGLAVLEGVVGGSFLTLLCAGAGGFLGVLAVGLQAFLGWGEAVWGGDCLWFVDCGLWRGGGSGGCGNFRVDEGDGHGSPRVAKGPLEADG